MGDFAADTLDDVPRFLSAVARLAGDDGSQQIGLIHILSLHAKVAFQVSLAGKTSTTQDSRGNIWYGTEDITNLGTEDLVVVEDLNRPSNGLRSFVP